MFIFFLQIQDADKAKTMDVVVFEGPPKTEQVLWPTHCVQESWGAEMHKDLKVISRPIFFKIHMFMISFQLFAKFTQTKS